MVRVEGPRLGLQTNGVKAVHNVVPAPNSTPICLPSVIVVVYTAITQNEKRIANCNWREKFAWEVIFPKLLLPKETFGP